MSYEEDFLMSKVKELEKRVKDLELWAGNNSEKSQEKLEKTLSENEPSDQQPAPMTDNPFLKTKVGSSDATSTDGLSDNFDV